MRKGKLGTLTYFAFTDRPGLRNLNGKMGDVPSFLFQLRNPGSYGEAGESEPSLPRQCLAEESEDSSQESVVRISSLIIDRCVLILTRGFLMLERSPSRLHTNS